MRFIRTILFAPLSWIYGSVVAVRNWLYDSGLKDIYIPDIPVVSIGNITVGGTGKTPFVEYLIEFLSSYYEVAVLSRGYKRKTKGFILADDDSNFRIIGDEPSQIKMKFPSINVAVCEDRVEGIKRLRELCPSVELIILDDAFQHRSVQPWLDIVLMDYNRPIYDDYMLPLGTLRDLPNQLPRAEIVVTTKCSKNLPPFEQKVVNKYLNLLPYQTLLFTRISYSDPVLLFPSSEDKELSPVEFGKDTPVFVMTGIGNPDPLIEHISDKYTLAGTLLFPDHHVFMVRDIRLLESKLSNCPENTIVVITEKDAVKMYSSRKISDNLRKRIHYIGIRHEFCDDSMEKTFKDKLLAYVAKNQKNSITDTM